MNLQSLIDNRNAVETKFNETQKQAEELNEELLRLQGEHRALTALIGKDESQELETVTKKASK